jgi:tRNA dimethylallyltransferase
MMPPPLSSLPSDPFSLPPDSLHPRTLYLVGPTGSGKSALAIALAEKWGAEIVNGDAFQLYVGMRVLTAAPSVDEMARAPHHLYHVLSPETAMDAARYAALAQRTIAEIHSRHRLAIVVGGSGLYLKALTHKLDDLPSDPEIRHELAQLPLAEKVAQLRVLDPTGAAQMNLKNPRYVERALEICLITKQPASNLKRGWEADFSAHLRGYHLTWDREALHQRIAFRSAELLKKGAIDEVASLPVSSTGKPFAVEKAIGVAPIRAFLNQEITRDQLLDRLIISTRQYAKRQITWFRRESWLTPLSMPF